MPTAEPKRRGKTSERDQQADGEALCWLRCATSHVAELLEPTSLQVPAGCRSAQELRTTCLGFRTAVTAFAPAVTACQFAPAAAAAARSM